MTNEQDEACEEEDRSVLALASEGPKAERSVRRKGYFPLKYRRLTFQMTEPEKAGGRTDEGASVDGLIGALRIGPA